jgi:CRISPR-associated protein Csx10
MKRLLLTAMARSPLAIRADHAPDGSATALIIPGSTLLGALASAHRTLWPREEDEFQCLFLQERVWYPQLYPAFFESKHDRGHQKTSEPVQPLPRTAQSCKHFGGFTSPAGKHEDEEPHGVRDTLLDHATFTLLERQGAPISACLKPLKEHQSCACGQSLEHISGFYRCAREDASDRLLASSLRQLQTRTGINRTWGVVEESILYNREIFADGMTFWGELRFPGDDGEILRIALERLLEAAALAPTKEEREEKTGLLRLGTGRTRGLGAIATRVSRPLPDEVGRASLAGRLADFDAELRTKAGAYQARTPAACYFAVTLTSPAILRDAHFRHQQSLDAFTLEQALKLAPRTLTRLYQVTGLVRVQGWNELWGTPRPVDFALEVGSVFLFASSLSQEQLLAPLYELEEQGLGSRRVEGFGRLSISDPFHLEGELR